MSQTNGNQDFTALGMLKHTFCHILYHFYGLENISAYAAINGENYGIYFALDDDATAKDENGLNQFYDDIKPIEDVSRSGTLFISPMNSGIRTGNLDDLMQILETLSEAYELGYEDNISDIVRIETNTDLDRKRMTAEGLQTLLKRPDLLAGIQKKCYMSLTDVARDVMACNSLEEDRPPYSFDDLRRAVATENRRQGLTDFKGRGFYIN